MMMRLSIFPQLELSIEQDELSQACQRLRQFLNRHALPPKIIYDVELVLKEMAGNIIRYGKARGKVLVTLEIHTTSFLIHIIDNGIPFDPTRVPVLNLSGAALEATQEGSGIHMVRSIVDEMHYRRIGDENQLEIRIDMHPPQEEAKRKAC